MANEQYRISSEQRKLRAELESKKSITKALGRNKAQCSGCSGGRCSRTSGGRGMVRQTIAGSRLRVNRSREIP